MDFFKAKFRQLLPFLAIIGPGIITGSVDNDAGGIATYSIAGARFGFSLLWILFLTTFALAITQEIGARMGLVTGKGLASLIREKFGIRWTAFIMLILFVANIGTISAEFAGIAAALEILGVNRYISIPIAGLLIYLFVTRGSFRRIERIFLVSSAFYIVYIVSAFLANPNWATALHSLVTPQIQTNKAYFLTMIAVIGTTITPWGQFFIQDFVVDKKLSKEDLKIERGDVFLGSFITNFISFFIITACASTIFAAGLQINDVKDAAFALEPLAGKFSSLLFSFGLLNASIFGAALVPIATSYVITEAFGFESGLNYSFSEAPAFYSLFTFSLILGALIVLLPFLPLLSILVLTQTLNALLLLPVLVFLYLLANDKKLLNGYTNGRVVNTAVILTFFTISAASLAYVVSLFIQ